MKLTHELEVKIKAILILYAANDRISTKTAINELTKSELVHMLIHFDYHNQGGEVIKESFLGFVSGVVDGEI